MSDLQSTDAPAATTLTTFADLKRKARSVRSRHPLAKGGRGSAKRRGRKITIDSPVSQNSPQKDLAQPFADNESREARVNSTISAVAEVLFSETTIPLSDEEHWRNAGDINVLVYARPLNPRMLLVQLDDGSHGRLLMHPDERSRFSVRSRLWVRLVEKDIYCLAGRYNRYGKRVA